MEPLAKSVRSDYLSKKIKFTYEDSNAIEGGLSDKRADSPVHLHPNYIIVRNKLIN